MTEKSTAQSGPAPAPDQQASNGTADRLPSSNGLDGSTAGTVDSNVKDGGQTSPASRFEGTAAGTRTSPKKRRKVNHGEISPPGQAAASGNTPQFACCLLQPKTTLLTIYRACSMRLLSAIGKPPHHILRLSLFDACDEGKEYGLGCLPSLVKIYIGIQLLTGSRLLTCNSI